VLKASRSTFELAAAGLRHSRAPVMGRVKLCRAFIACVILGLIQRMELNYVVVIRIGRRALRRLAAGRIIGS
jgi:hypothetical protein